VAIGDGRPAGHAAGEDSLSALGILAALRADHERTELELIDGARRGGASWLSVARALGLRSRQAAEQRWRRLRARTKITLSRQQIFDDLPVALLRHQVVVVGMLLAGRLSAEDDPVGATDGDHPWRAVSLARQTLSQARGAPAGALHDLARLAVGDLRRVPAEVLGQPLADAVSRLACLVGHARREP
jgi:hypothetical protein